MAKKLIRTYTFNAAAKTVAISGYVTLSNLLLITNTTRNTIIYNFADPTQVSTISYSPTTNITTITLGYNTTVGMANADKLMIYIDDQTNMTRPEEAFTDPVDKARVSEPQALIDTDFEYGTQISKWENITMTNNRPFAYAVPTQIPNVNGMTMNTNSRVVTISLSTGNAPANGTPIVVQDTYLTIANGTYIIESGGGTSTFTYTAKALNTTSITAIFDPNKTNVFRGTTYSNSQIGGVPLSVTASGNAVTVTTSTPHGLSIGNEIAVLNVTASTANSPTGSFVVATTLSPTSFVYYTPNAPTGLLVTSSAAIFPRPQGAVLHRPFDGGVMFSSNGTSNYEETVRQTRRYFRYQSGKGIQVSSGTTLKPSLQIDSLTASGTTVTVTTKEQHNIQPGTQVIISGANETDYNGTFTITNVTGFNTFTYTALSAPSVTTASGAYYASVSSWYGAVNRLGIFDSQNGIFFEFDGQTLYAVQRKSTFQISGKVTVTNGSNTITQTNAAFPTLFTKQLNIGDYIVLRGQSYRIQDIDSDTTMTVTPSYKGATSSYVIVSKTQDTKVAQSAWNLDTMDGNGPSGYTLDLSKMQMFFIDYSWYGAGAIRWGLRGADGRVTYVHKIANNNANYEAYMRSGNLPGRYQTVTQPPYTQLSASLGADSSSLSVVSTIGFPPTGTLSIRSGSLYEYINYSGTGSTAFNNLTRGKVGNTSNTLTTTVAVGSNSAIVSSATNLQVGQRVFSTASAFPDGTFITAINGTTLTLSQAALGANPTIIVPPMGTAASSSFNFLANDPTIVELAYPTFAPALSHWGTSVIMDGKFDDDKSLLFTYGQSGSINLPTGSTSALFSIRVAPSVDNGLPAAFGARELVNRMQLVLRTLDISLNYSNSLQPNILIRANLNGQPSGSTTTTWTNAVGNVASSVNSSLAQIADYSGKTVGVVGGETTGGFFVNGTSTTDLILVRDLGNAILGGGGTTSDTGIYPDGPDVLTITATNVGLIPVNAIGRISWTEAQA
jgi:hypothetical protein